MLAEVARADLSRVLAAITKVVEPRNTIPLLRNVVLTADGSSITARGTDLNVEVISKVEATVSSPGVTCISAHQISDIVKRMAGDKVTLEFEPGTQDGTGTLTIKCGRSRFKLPSIPHESMPSLALSETEHEFVVDLAALLAPVSFAIADNDSRYYLMGAYLHVVDGRLRAVGCDGNCLSSYAVDEPIGAHDMPGIIVPRRVTDLIGGMKGECLVRCGKDRICIAQGATTIYAKLIEGKYIDYTRALPAVCDKVIKVHKEDLIGAIDRASILTSTLPGRAIRMHVSEDSIKLVAADTDGRDCAEDVTAALTGEPFKVAFASDYLRGILQAAPGSEVSIGIDSVGGRSVYHSVSDEHFLGALGAYRTAA